MSHQINRLYKLRTTLVPVEIFACGLSRTTLCFLSLKKSDKMYSRLPDIPFCDSLESSSLCHTFSKALEISRKMISTSNRSLDD